MSDKKIAILVAGLPPIYNGGTEIATVSIAQYAAKQGHDVHVVALDGTNQGETAYSIKGVQIHRVRTISAPYLYGMAATPGIISAIKQIKPDIIHTQGTQMALSAYIASKITGIPYMLYGRGEIYMQWFLKRPLSVFLMSHAERVIAQTQNMRNEMLKYVQRDIEVIPNGIDISRFGDMTQEKARVILNLPRKNGSRGIPERGSEIIMSVGKFRQEKNVGLFLKIAAIDLRNPQRTYISVGGGKEFTDIVELSNRLKSGVVFSGEVNNSDIPIYMAAADVLVNTSYSEGFPMTILEAYAAGLPVVCPKITGLSEIVRQGVNGFLYESNNEYSAMQAIDHIMNHSDIRQQIGQSNKEKSKQYSWDNVVRRLYG